MKTLYTLAILKLIIIVNYVSGQDCPSNSWVKFNNRCFLFKVSSNRDFVAWNSAKLSCENENGGDSLVSIHSPDENEFIYQEALKQMNTKAHIWIGMHKTVYGKDFPYIWEDNSLVNYVNWDENEPNDIDGTQNCVRMYEFNGKWDDFDCNGAASEAYHGYICQATAVSRDDSREVIPPMDEGCCRAGDVFAIIFGIIIAIEIIAAIFGYLYFYKWDKKLPWAAKTT